MAAAGASRTESERFERWLELIPHCNRAEEGIELEELAALFQDSAEGVLDDVQALVDREYYLPGSFADSLTILIDGERLDLRSPDHFRRPIRLAPMEALAVQLGLQLLPPAGPDDQGSISRVAELLADLVETASVSSAVGESDLNEGETLRCGAGLSGDSAEALQMLSEAILGQRMVELIYFKPYELEQPSPRLVAPWALAEVRGTWYLLAEDVAAGDPRLFRLDRMVHVSTTESVFKAPDGFEIGDYIEPASVYRESEDDLRIAIRYAPGIASWVMERYADAQASVDGSVIIAHRCRSPWWAVTHVLGCGANAEMLDSAAAQLLRQSIEPLAAELD